MCFKTSGDVLLNSGLTAGRENKSTSDIHPKFTAIKWQLNLLGTFF